MVLLLLKPLHYHSSSIIIGLPFGPSEQHTCRKGVDWGGGRNGQYPGPKDIPSNDV